MLTADMGIQLFEDGRKKIHDVRRVGGFSNDDVREDELDVVQERPRIEAVVHGSGMDALG